MTIDDLITKLEAATGPDRDLDVAIALSLGWTLQKMKGDTRPYCREPGVTAYYMRSEPPCYTSSIDAAMTLVPAEFRVDVQRSDSGYACVWGLAGNRSVRAATPALALCIAAIKARAAGG